MDPATPPAPTPECTDAAISVVTALLPDVDSDESRQAALASVRAALDAGAPADDLFWALGSFACHLALAAALIGRDPDRDGDLDAAEVEQARARQADIVRVTAELFRRKYG